MRIELTIPILSETLFESVRIPFPALLLLTWLPTNSFQLSTLIFHFILRSPKQTEFTLMPAKLTEVCSFLEKFERISNRIVKVLARYSSAAPPPAALPLFFSRAIFSLTSFEQEKGFIVSLPHPPIRGHETPKLIINKFFTFFEQ